MPVALLDQPTSIYDDATGRPFPLASELSWAKTGPAVAQSTGFADGDLATTVGQR